MMFSGWTEILAYGNQITAHLAEIPAALEVEATESGGMEVGISIPLSLSGNR